LDGLTVRAPAKVNLFLEVLARRPDGYHDLESIFAELDLADTLALRATDAPDIRLTCDHEGIPLDGRNLVVRAAELLRERCGVRRGVEMRLEKRIPAGGGLGGGSSDAAAALQGLNKLWDLGLDRTALLGCAAGLGSDVPFFLYGGTALCTGRGERVQPVPNACCLDLALVFPEWGIGTADAYRALEPDDFGSERSDRLREALAAGEMKGVADASFNRFERPVFALEPRERDLYEALGALGGATIRMSGSGSTLFALLPPGESAEALAGRARGLRGVRDATVARIDAAPIT